MNIKLLDCTLRDGGYINDWDFGSNTVNSIIKKLINSNIDAIEVGFLDERVNPNKNKTIVPNMKDLNEMIGDIDKKDTELVAMIDYGTFGIEKIIPKSESKLDGIRVIFKKENIKEALEFCTEIKKKGYKVYANAVMITTYTEEEVLKLIQEANNSNIDVLTMVDTSGTMYKEDLIRYYEIIEQNLNPEIQIGFHSHNTLQLSFANCAELIKIHNPNRIINLDGTLMGMGKGSGNAFTELLATYLNKRCDKKYDLSQIVDILENEMTELNKHFTWGYNLTRYIASIPDCYYKYVDYYHNIKKIPYSEIERIISIISEEEKYNFNVENAEYYYKLYNKKYKYIIFDIDGTLLDTTEGIISAIDYTIKKCNLNELDYSDKLYFIGPPIQDSFQKAYGLSKEEANRIADVFRNRYKTKELYKARPYDGIIELLEELKRADMSIGVATYKREDYAKAILEYFGIDKYCDAIHGSDYEMKKKKHDIVGLCVKELNPEDLSKVVMIGDSMNDYVGAKKNGIDFLGVTYGFGFKDNEELDNNRIRLVKTVRDVRNSLL